MDDDLHQFSHEAALAEIRRLRAGIRAYRDSGPNPTWRHAELWELLPDHVAPSSSGIAETASIATAARDSLRWIAAL